MATRIYFPSTGASAINPTLGTWTETTGFVRRAAVTSRISSAMTDKIQARTASAANNTWLDTQYVIGPLAAQTFGASTVKGTIRALESAANDNVDAMRLLIRVVAPDATTFRGTIYGPTNGTVAEFNTTLRAKRLAVGGATTSVTVTEGDYLVIDIGATATTGGVSISTTINYGDNSATDLGDNETDTAANNPFIEFAANMKFLQRGFGQAKTSIKVLDVEGFGQAQAFIAYGTIRDTFTRSVSNGLGTADLGGDWTPAQTGYDVNGTQATIVSAASTIELAQSIITNKKVTFTIDFSFSSNTAGSLQISGITGWGLAVNPSAGSIIVERYFDGASSSFNAGAYVANDLWRVELQISNASNSTARFRLRAYKIGSPIPDYSFGPISTTVNTSTVKIFPNTASNITIDYLEVTDNAWSELGQAQAFIINGTNAFGQAQAKIGPTILLVVADKTSLTTMDTNLRNRLIVNLNYAVQVVSDEDAVPSLTGISAIVIAESVVNATLGTKYRNVAAPLMLLDSGPAINMDMASAIGSIPTDSVEVVDGSHIAAAGKSGIVVVFTSTDTIRWITSNSNAKVYLVENVNPSGVTYDAGVTMFNAHVSEGRRLFLGTFFDNTAALTNSANWDFFDAGIQYLVNPTTLNNIFSQAQAKISAFGVNAFGQAQSDIKQTYRVYAQSQADIKQTYNGFGQANADIKKTSNIFGQSQADIKAISRGYGQTNADIKATSNGFAQSQALIIPTRVFAQAQSDIKAISQGYGQAQADINATYNVFAQVQAKIAVSGTNVYAQVQADIKQTYQAYAQAQADISAVGRGFGQANADIKATINQFAQAQSDIKTTVNVFAQAQADIKQTYNAFAQAQADIKQIYQGYGQTQADIKQTYRGYGQSQAYIKVTDIEGFGQTQADIKQTYRGYAQSQADIKTSYRGYAQGQADIKATYNGFAQTQTDIKATSNAFAQAQADIKSIYQKYGQAQADIKAISNAYSQAQADIKTIYQGYGQSNSDIKVITNVFAQSQTDIKQVYQVYAQAQAKINAFGVNRFAQAQADILFLGNVAVAQTQAKINSFGFNQFGQAQALIVVKDNEGFGQVQAKILQTYNGFGQANADIKAVGQGYGQANATILGALQRFAQAQADIKSIGRGYGQACADIKATSRVYAQAQADILVTTNRFAQAQGYIKVTDIEGFGQSQADIKATYQGYGQSQSDIKATSRGYGQACADIKQTYNAYGQVNASIITTKQSYGQSQADIKATNNVYGQAQANIKRTENAYGQAQGTIKQTYRGYGQAQAQILLEQFGYGQAQAYIKLIRFGAGQAQADILVITRGYANAQGYIATNVIKVAQAQAQIKVSINAYGQAQGYILSGKNSFGQAQALIFTTVNKYGQTQALIVKSTAFAQAQAFIHQPHTLANVEISDERSMFSLVSDEAEFGNDIEDNEEDVQIEEIIGFTITLSDEHTIIIILIDSAY